MSGTLPVPDTDITEFVFEGPCALLLHRPGQAFSDEVQARIWRLAEKLKSAHGVRETVPGMNNLMITFDPLEVDGAKLRTSIRKAWSRTKPAKIEQDVHDVPVVYGGEMGVDLIEFAMAKDMPVNEVIARHAAPLYSVAAVGAMPGFVYLSGLDPLLAAPRLSNPRSGVPKGSVIIGGTQAGIMPVTAPSGWHILGRTSLDLFDPHRERPAWFKPGDRIRFVPQVAA
jgi:KipI family sensor histidine kinase inhibitor